MQDDFVLLGDALWLDFLNTSRGRTADVPDLIADPRGWARWCALMQLDGDPAMYREALELRTHLTRLAAALASGSPVPSKSLGALNARLEAISGHQQLVRVAGRWRLPFVADTSLSTLDRIAMSAAETLAVPQAELRTCSGPTCSLFILDSTPQLTRRWCSPTHCGRGMRVERRRRGTR